MALAVDGGRAGEAALEGLLRTETPRLLRVAYSILRDPQAAEDAVQETLLLAWRNWGALRDPGQSGSWLMRICVRRSIRSRQSLLQRLRLEGSYDHSTAHAVEVPAAHPMWDWDRSFRALSRLQRAVVILHYHHGFSLDECANLVGCRPGTARTHLKRALSKLRAEIGHDDA